MRLFYALLLVVPLLSLALPARSAEDYNEFQQIKAFPDMRITTVGSYVQCKEYLPLFVVTDRADVLEPPRERLRDVLDRLRAPILNQCPEIETMQVTGVLDGDPVYYGLLRENDDWRLITTAEGYMVLGGLAGYGDAVAYAYNEAWPEEYTRPDGRFLWTDTAKEGAKYLVEAVRLRAEGIAGSRLLDEITIHRNPSELQQIALTLNPDEIAGMDLDTAEERFRSYEEWVARRYKRDEQELKEDRPDAPFHLIDRMWYDNEQKRRWVEQLLRRLVTYVAVSVADLEAMGPNDAAFIRVALGRYKDMRFDSLNHNLPQVLGWPAKYTLNALKQYLKARAGEVMNRKTSELIERINAADLLTELERVEYSIYPEGKGYTDIRLSGITGPEHNYKDVGAGPDSWEYSNRDFVYWGMHAVSDSLYRRRVTLKNVTQKRAEMKYKIWERRRSELRTEAPASRLLDPSDPRPFGGDACILLEACRR